MKTNRKIQPSFSEVDHILNFNLPRSWEDLNQEQLKYVALVLTLFPGTKAKTYAFIRLTGIKINSKNKHGWICCYRLSWKRKLRFLLAPWQLLSFTEQLDFILQPPNIPVRMDRISHYEAIDVKLHGMSFNDYLICENFFQGYIYKKDSSLLKQMIPYLYKDVRKGWHKRLPAHRFKEWELTALFLWWYGVKMHFAEMFPHFFRPFKPSDDEEGSFPDLMGAMNAQIRALTGGDITKEKEVMQMDCWRALTELDAKANDIQKMKEKRHE